MRIGMNQYENTDAVGVEDTEVAGPGGANLTGGDVTRPQDAARASDEATQARLDSKKMEQLQQQGKVGHQRKVAQQRRVAQQREEFQPEADGEGYQTKAADDLENSSAADEAKNKQ